MSDPNTPSFGQQPPNSQPPYPYNQPPGAMGYAPPPAPPQKRGMKAWQWLLIVFGGVIVLCCVLGVVIVGLGSAASKSTTSGNNTASGPSSSGSSSATATPQSAAKVGSAITDNDVSCTLVSARVVSGDEFTKPAAGNVFVLVTVKIVNHSSSEFDYNPYDFNGESSAGNLTHPEIIFPSSVSDGNQLQDGTLAAGGSVQGQLIVQVPKGDHQAKLTWQPGFFSDKTSDYWLLGL